MKLKYNDSFVHYNLFLNRSPKLVLNHVIIYNNLVEEMHLDKSIVLSRALLKTKKEKYCKLPDAARTKPLKKLEKEIKDLQKDITDVNKKHFSLFKQLLHETIRKDWEKVVLD